jgi:hypothetical protein
LAYGHQWLKPGAWGCRSEGRSEENAPRFSPYRSLAAHRPLAYRINGSNPAHGDIEAKGAAKKMRRGFRPTVLWQLIVLWRTASMAQTRRMGISKRREQRRKCAEVFALPFFGSSSSVGVPYQWLKPGAWGYRSEGSSEENAPRFSPYRPAST